MHLQSGTGLHWFKPLLCNRFKNEFRGMHICNKLYEQNLMKNAWIHYTHVIGHFTLTDCRSGMGFAGFLDERKILNARDDHIFSGTLSSLSKNTLKRSLLCIHLASCCFYNLLQNGHGGRTIVCDVEGYILKKTIGPLIGLIFNTEYALIQKLL